MIKLEKTQVVGWEPSIRGMRNPKNSWDRSDSDYRYDCFNDKDKCKGSDYRIGPNDHKLMMSLAKGGPVHAKYRRMLVVYVDITAPLYFWKELDTYKVGTVANSCSTMHKIHDKEFTLEDFSCEHLINQFECAIPYNLNVKTICDFKGILEETVAALNTAREYYLETKDKTYWWQMIQLLPSSYNQKRTVMLSYETLANIYEWRRNHKLTEWHEVCKWIESLPYSEIITQPIVEKDKKVDIEEVTNLIESVRQEMPGTNPVYSDVYDQALDAVLKRLKEK